jgi:3-dehydroquinate dehydratase/shikimate dehydrogenase
MICLSIAQQSQRFALVDMLNAGPRCDLIEIRLDRFQKPPEINVLLKACPKPAIVSCRRRQDGGDWSGSEESRLALLRQAVLDGAPYVEIEHDCIDQIRRYGPTKRVITYTNLTEVPENIDEIYAEACLKDVDVVKLTVPARTPEETWPIIKIVARSRIPTVAVGLGRNGIMLNVLGRRYKAPWTYAALEKGMEAYPGMASVFELEDVYDYKSITSKTPLLALTGMSEEQRLTARILNHGFRLADNRTRCLPIQMGRIDHFGKFCAAIKLAGIIVDDEHRTEILDLAQEQEEAVRVAGATDFIAIRNEKWNCFNTLYRAVPALLEETYARRHPGASLISGRTFLVIGCSGTGRSIAVGLMKHGGKVIVADSLHCRYVASGAVYSTMCDGLVLCRADHGPEPRGPVVDMPRSAIRDGMIAVDLSSYPFESDFLREVHALGGVAVSSREIFLRAMRTILHAYTGRSFSDAELTAGIPEEDWPDELLAGAVS